MYHINFITVIIEKEDELRSLLYEIDISSSIKICHIHTYKQYKVLCLNK